MTPNRTTTRSTRDGTMLGSDSVLWRGAGDKAALRVPVAGLRAQVQSRVEHCLLSLLTKARHELANGADRDLSRGNASQRSMARITLPLVSKSHRTLWLGATIVDDRHGSRAGPNRQAAKSAVRRSAWRLL